jgi:hypothetical protein
MYSYPADEIGSSVWVMKEVTAPAADDCGPGSDARRIIYDIYDRRFRRPPNTSGLDFWCDAYKSHQNATRLEAQILYGTSGSDDIEYIKNNDARRASAIDFTVENINKMPSVFLKQNEGKIVSVYSDWLGRLPKSGGLSYWAEKQRVENLSYSQIICYIVYSSQPGKDREYVIQNKKQNIISTCNPLGYPVPDWLK